MLAIVLIHSVKQSVRVYPLAISGRGDKSWRKGDGALQANLQVLIMYIGDTTHVPASVGVVYPILSKDIQEDNQPAKDHFLSDA